MIRFEPTPEPDTFDERCRTRGQQWLVEHPDAERPHAYWKEFADDLASAFRSLCAHSAMWIVPGTVEHSLSVRSHPQLAYEWSNYRYAAGWLNSAKGTSDDEVLDPFEIEDGWFEILLPSLQLVMTERVPTAQRARAAFTLERLGLRDDERCLRQRRAWMELYENDQLTLEGLELRAPLLARAIQAQVHGDESS